MRLTCLLLLLSAVAISADLQSDFQDILNRLTPRQEDGLIQPRVTSELQTRTIFNFLKEFLEISEVKSVLEFFEKSGINLKVVLFQTIPQLLGHPSILQMLENASNSSNDFLDTKVFLQLQPSAEVMELIDERIQMSPEFAKFAELAQEPEFKALLYRAMNSRAFHEQVDGGDSVKPRFWTELFSAVVSFFVSLFRK